MLHESAVELVKDISIEKKTKPELFCFGSIPLYMLDLS